MGDAQLKTIRESAKIFDAETKNPNRDAFTTPPDSLITKRTKLPRVEDQTAPPTRVDPDEESKNREQKLPIPIQANQNIKGTSEATPPGPLHRKQI